MDKKVYISKSLKETALVAKEIRKSVQAKKTGAFVIFLLGDLGAGKTTLTKALAKEFAVKGTVISPTFILAKMYTIPKDKVFKKLIHIDAYRFDTPAEAKVLRLNELVGKRENLIVIEWPEKLGKGLKADLRVQLKTLSEESKNISW